MAPECFSDSCPLGFKTMISQMGISGFAQVGLETQSPPVALWGMASYTVETLLGPAREDTFQRSHAAVRLESREPSLICFRGPGAVTASHSEKDSCPLQQTLSYGDHRQVGLVRTRLGFSQMWTLKRVPSTATWPWAGASVCLETRTLCFLDRPQCSCWARGSGPLASCSQTGTPCSCEAPVPRTLTSRGQGTTPEHCLPLQSGTYALETCTSCQLLDRFCFRPSKADRPSFLFSSPQCLSLAART